MQPFHANKSFINSLWEEDKQQEINKYISENNMNFKSTTDLM